MGTKRGARVWVVFNDVVGDSPLATKILDDDGDDYRASRARDSGDERVSRLVLHQTGSTIVGAAVKGTSIFKKGGPVDPIEGCLSYYTTKPTSSHYLIGYDGTLYQMSDEHLRVGHVGVGAAERAAYLAGTWARGGAAETEHGRAKISAETVRLWRERWPKYKSPQHLFPTSAINNVSVGVEMPPCRYRAGRGWTYVADPLVDATGRPYGHTTAQHVTAAALACDIAARWGWPDEWQHDPKGGPNTPFVLGHEDVDLFERSDKNGGWDPGGLRVEPYWSWGFFWSAVRVRQSVTSIGAFLRKAHQLFGDVL